jgi:hypothetical protein
VDRKNAKGQASVFLKIRRVNKERRQLHHAAAVSRATPKGMNGRTSDRVSKPKHSKAHFNYFALVSPERRMTGHARRVWKFCEKHALRDVGIENFDTGDFTSVKK